MKGGACSYRFYSNMLLLFAVAVLLSQACRHKHWACCCWYQGDVANVLKCLWFSLRWLPSDPIYLGRTCLNTVNKPGICAALEYIYRCAIVFARQGLWQCIKERGKWPLLPTFSLSLFLKPKCSFTFIIYFCKWQASSFSPSSSDCLTYFPSLCTTVVFFFSFFFQV